SDVEAVDGTVSRRDSRPQQRLGVSESPKTKGSATGLGCWTNLPGIEHQRGSCQAASGALDRRARISIEGGNHWGRANGFGCTGGAECRKHLARRGGAD